MKLRVFAVVAAFFASVVPSSAEPAVAAPAETEALNFSVYVYGIKFGVLQLAIVQNQTQYAAKGRVATTGLIAAFAPFNFDGEVHGYKDGTRLWPNDYSAKIVKNSGETDVKMRYKNRTPEVLSYLPEREPNERDVDPAKQKGAVDLISSAYMFLRDAPKEELCNKKIETFDGRRRSHVRQDPPRFNGDKATCTGTYERLAGFTLGEMADQTVFPFTLYYEMQEDGNYRLMRVETQSTIGTARLVRRD